ncbi:MAG: Lrp/AsnC family transcriptional regulator [Candidatus Hodarchaeales archaeon]
MSDIVVNGVLSRESEALLRNDEVIDVLKANCYDLDRLSSLMRLSKDDINLEIKRLETGQQVLRRLIWLNPRALPHPIETMHLWLRVTPRDVNAVSKTLCGVPGVSHVSFLSGKYSIFVKIHGRNTGDLRRRIIDPETGIYSIRGIISIWLTYVINDMLIQGINVKQDIPLKGKKIALELVEDGTLSSLARDPDSYDSLEMGVLKKLEKLRSYHAIEFTLQLKEKYYNLPFVNQVYSVFAYGIFPRSPPPKDFYNKFNYEIFPGITDISIPTGDIKILFRMRSASLLTVDQQLASMVKWNTPTRFGKSLCFNSFKDASIAEVI